MSLQIYEDYWKLTVEYTDIHDEKFIGTLQIIVDYMDNHNTQSNVPFHYKNLQQLVFTKYPKKDSASVRKSINQFVKLGFIEPLLKSYHSLVKDFLLAKTKAKRNMTFSKIFYTNSKFNASVTEPSNINQINFIVKTLIEVATLDYNDLIGLMTVDLKTINKEFLTRDELNFYVKQAINSNFHERKYNQIGFFQNFLKKIDAIAFSTTEKKYCLIEDSKEIFGDEINKSNKRDPYLHKLYKRGLMQDFNLITSSAIPKCMIENLAYPVLIASHIKPFIKADDNEKYDPENGLLLSRNLDSLFDLNYITFNSDNGFINISNTLDNDLKIYLKNHHLNPIFLTNKRKEYLKYHNNLLR